MANENEKLSAGRIRERNDGSLEWSAAIQHNENVYQKGIKPAAFFGLVFWVIAALLIYFSHAFDFTTTMLFILVTGLLIVLLPTVAVGLAHRNDRSLETFEMTAAGVKRIFPDKKEVSIPYSDVRQVRIDRDHSEIEVLSEDRKCTMPVCNEDLEFAEEYLLNHLKEDTDVIYKS